MSCSSQLSDVLRGKHPKAFLLQTIPHILRSCCFLAVNGGGFIMFICLVRCASHPTPHMSPSPSPHTHSLYHTHLHTCSLCLCSFCRKLIGRFYFYTTAFLPAFLAALVAIMCERKSRSGCLHSHSDFNVHFKDCVVYVVVVVYK